MTKEQATREALRMALEALEKMLFLAEHEGWEGFDKQYEAITAIKKALQSNEQVEPVAWEGGEGWESLAWELCANENGEESCNELIWEGGPIPEPWGDRWMKYESEAKRLIALVHKHTHPPVPTAQPEQEPVAWRFRSGTWFNREVHWRYIDTLEGAKGLLGLEPLYTTPPQRKPLLASDIVMMYDENPRSDSEMIAFARAIEAAHGIRSINE